MVPAGLALFVLLSLSCHGRSPGWSTRRTREGAAARALRRRRMVGYALGAVHGGAWILHRHPAAAMALLELVLMIEAARPAAKNARGRRLAWSARGLFITVTYLTDMMLGRWVDLPFGPLLDFAATGLTVGAAHARNGNPLLTVAPVADFYNIGRTAPITASLLWRFHASPRAAHLGVLRNFEHPSRLCSAGS